VKQKKTVVNIVHELMQVGQTYSDNAYLKEDLIPFANGGGEQSVRCALGRGISSCPRLRSDPLSKTEEHLNDQFHITQRPGNSTQQASTSLMLGRKSNEEWGVLRGAVTATEGVV